MPQLAFKIAAMLPSSGLMAEALEEFAAAGCVVTLSPRV
jgi:hypothetical protein